MRLTAMEQAHAEHSARTYGVKRLNELVALGERVLPRVKECYDTAQSIRLDDD